MKLTRHEGHRIVVERNGTTHELRNRSRTYFKQVNTLLLEEVQRWKLDGQEVRISRKVLRRLHWPVSGWRLS